MLGAEQLLVLQLLQVAPEIKTRLGLQLSSRQPGLRYLCSQLLAATASSLALPAGVGPAVWPFSLR